MSLCPYQWQPFLYCVFDKPLTFHNLITYLQATGKVELERIQGVELVLNWPCELERQVPLNSSYKSEIDRHIRWLNPVPGAHPHLHNMYLFTAYLPLPTWYWYFFFKLIETKRGLIWAQHADNYFRSCNSKKNYAICNAINPSFPKYSQHTNALC